MTTLTVFPNRVWFQCANGLWASREADKEDRERRAEYISRCNFRSFTKLLTKGPKIGDGLRRGTNAKR